MMIRYRFMGIVQVMIAIIAIGRAESLVCHPSNGLVVCKRRQTSRRQSDSHRCLYASLYPQGQLQLGEYIVSLKKPLGMILEEREEGGGNSGVRIKEVLKGTDGGSAWKSGMVAPGDLVQSINQVDVSTYDFDSVMNLLVESSSPVHLCLGDGLGQLDMPKNVVQQLKTSEDAFLIDAVVRQAVREIRRDGRLGELLGVEVVIGAGVQDSGKRGLARFFAIFSTDGVTSYSCNVSATGVRANDAQGDTGPVSPKVKIVSLSCAKDEGLGRTYDLIQENEEM
jgi:PDZ domain